MADTPSDAYHSTFDALQPGDIIVMGTDGLFDNVFIEELAAVLERELGALFEEGGMDCGESSMEHDEDEVVDIGGGRNANSSDSGKSDASASGIGGKIANAVFAAPTTAWLETLRVRVQRAADAMVHEAAKLARSNRISPFGKAAMQHGWVEYTGGKVDDITVVTALVVAREYRDDEATEDD